MISLGVGGLIFVHRSAWVPEKNANAIEALKGPLTAHSPDHTRTFLLAYHPDNCIYAGSDPNPEQVLFKFSLHDSGLGLESHRTPLHYAAGFIDEDRCVLVFLENENEMYRIWHRRFPEWWWGHFYRPEVWAAGLLALVWIFKAVYFIQRKYPVPV